MENKRDDGREEKRKEGRRGTERLRAGSNLVSVFN